MVPGKDASQLALRARVGDEIKLDILIVSPHRDDAAFSLSISIDHWLSVGHRVTILNAFTKSLYAPYSDAGSVHHNDRLSYVSAMRKKEDAQFLKHVRGTRFLDLNIKDAPIRLRCDSSVVCDMEVNPEDTCIPKIRKAVTELRDQSNGELCLVLPLGLGHHVDHRTARDAALPVSATVPCAFYEELPYATREGVRVDLSRFREDAATRLHEPLSPILCHGTHTHPAEYKKRIALLYSSQIDEPTAELIADFSHRYHGAERLWANQSWLSIAVSGRLSSRQRDLEAEPLPA